MSMQLREITNIVLAHCRYCDVPITRNETAVDTGKGIPAHADCDAIMADLAYLAEARERELFPIREA